jgi:hypothetical protein
MARKINEAIETAKTISADVTSQGGHGGAILVQTCMASGIVATANTAIATFSIQDG